MKVILIVTPHLSTGGAPQVTLNKIDLLKDHYRVICVEYQCLSLDFVVQRNRVKALLGEDFISLSENKDELLDAISKFNPDTIFFEEFTETFISYDILDKIYTKNRKYKIIESTHSSLNNSNRKSYLPDKFIFVSKYSLDMYRGLGVDSELIEYPIDEKVKKTDESKIVLGFDKGYKHILNVGLFTEGKNQGYIFELARKLMNHKILFHFVGNQAGNFQHYWEPIMITKPNNCIVHGEREDVDVFLQAADLFIFSSIFNHN